MTREELRNRLWPNDTIVEFGAQQLRHQMTPRCAWRLSGQAEVCGNGRPAWLPLFAAGGVGRIPPPQPPASIAEPTFESAAATPASAVEAVIPPVVPAERLFSKQRVLQVLVVLASGALLTGLALELGHLHRFGRPAPGRITSLAVLPLENLSGDTGQEYFADGLTAELITELAKIGPLHVISRTSAMRYKRTHKPLVEIARELNPDISQRV